MRRDMIMQKIEEIDASKERKDEEWRQE